MSDNVTQPIFTRGELTHRLAGRIDTAEYGQGVSNGANYVVLSQGPLRKRPGTGFISATKDSSAKSHLIPFIFNTLQTYALEFGNFYVRFFAQGGRVMNGAVPYEITSPYAIADVGKLDLIESKDVIYLVHKSYPIYKLTRLAETNWTFTQVNLFNGPYLERNKTSTYLTPSSTAKPAGTGVPLVVWDNITTNPPQIDAIFPVILSYTLAGAPLKIDGYSVHFASKSTDQAVWAARMIRTWTFQGQLPSSSDWVILDEQRAETDWLGGEERVYHFNNDTAYQAYRLNVTKNNGDQNDITVAEVTLKVKEYPMTLTFSSITGINRNTGFTNDDIGRFIRFKTADGYDKAFKITGVTSTTVVIGLYYGTWNFVSQNITNWSLGAFSKFTGYPSAIADYEGRLSFGGTLEEPRTVWLGSSIDLEGFAKSDPQVDTDPITVTLSGAQQNEILWMSPGKGLFIGTTENVTSIVSGDGKGPLTYKSIQQIIQTNFGASDIPPIRIGPAVLYASFYGSTVRELIYSFNDDAYDAPDISSFSEHLLASSIVDMVWARAPDQILYLVTSIGTLVALTYDRIQKVVGLTPLPTDGLVESITSLPGLNKRDDIYLQVNRTINGVTKRYIEYFKEPFEYQADNAAWFVDSGLTYSGTATNVLSGLSHLEGKFVAVVVTEPLSGQTGLGNPVAAIFGGTVVSGSLTLPSGVMVTNCIVGLPFTAYLTVMPSRVPTRDGISVYTRKSRVDSVTIDMYRSAGLEIQSPGLTDWADVKERRGYDLMDEPLPFFTGIINTTIEGSWEAKGVFTIRSQYPLPSCIMSLTSTLEKE